VFTANQYLYKASPQLFIQDTAQPAGTNKYSILGQSQYLYISAVNDAETVAAGQIRMDRAGNLLTSGALNLAGPIDLQSGANASLYLRDMTQPVNQRTWRIMNQAQQLRFYSQDDGESGHIIQATLDFAGGFNVRGGIGASGAISTPAGITGGNILSNGQVQAAGNKGIIESYDPNGPVNARDWVLYQNNNGVLYLQGRGDDTGIQFTSLICSRNSVVEFPQYSQHDAGAYFPARSSNPGLLDHYEEGNWTPFMYSTSGGQGDSYAIQDGRYTKIGQIIHVSFQVQVVASSMIQGSLLIGGLPFPCFELYHTGGFDYWTLTTNFYEVKAHLGPNNTAFYLIGRETPSTVGHGTVITVANLSTAGPFRGNFTYRTTT
jgi:hypothetical protein